MHKSRQDLVQMVVVASILICINFMMSMPASARELDFDAYSMISAGMTEAEVISRAGDPDRQIRSGRAVFQYVWLGDSQNGEWTTTVTFSFATGRVISVSRARK